MTETERETLVLKGMLVNPNQRKPTTMPNTITTQYKQFKDHKGSIRFQAVKSWETGNPDKPFEPNPIRDVYIDRALAQTGHTGCEITIRMY